MTDPWIATGVKKGLSEGSTNLAQYHNVYGAGALPLPIYAKSLKLLTIIYLEEVPRKTPSIAPWRPVNYFP
jgi:hypothetical protein